MTPMRIVTGYLLAVVGATIYALAGHALDVRGATDAALYAACLVVFGGAGTFVSLDVPARRRRRTGAWPDP
jgi:hypothetical protein